jgi:plasmid replication initiation protein
MSESFEIVSVNTPETLGVTPRFVLQHNAISRSIQNLSATAKKLTAMAMALLPADLSSLTASFTFTDFCKALDYEKGGESYKVFKDAVKECLKNTIHIETKSPRTGKDTWEGYTWFAYSKIDNVTGVCTMIFSHELAKVLIEMKRVYAKINLQDLGKLQSKYALRIFEIAKSYESLAGKDGNHSDTWYFERTIPELRKMLGVPDDAYLETRDFRKKVVELPAKEITGAGIGLGIKPEGIKHGRNLTAIRFLCTKAVRTTPVKRVRGKKTAVGGQVELPEPSPKTAGNREEKELEHLKELYPEEFTLLYAESLKKQPDFGGGVVEGFRKRAAQACAFAALKERHGVVK